MTDTKLIRIHIDISDVTAKINKMKVEIKEAESLVDLWKRRFTTFTRTGMRILGSLLRLAGTVTDVSIITSVLAGVQTQLTVRRLGIRAGIEAGKGNFVFAFFLIVQAGLLEMEFAMNLQNQEMMRQHLDRINAMSEMNS